MDIDSQLKNILSVTLQMDSSEIHSNLTAEEVPEWDSLQQMNIIVALEDEFNIRFDETESILLKDYASLLDALAQKTAL